MNDAEIKVWLALGTGPGLATYAAEYILRRVPLKPAVKPDIACYVLIDALEQRAVARCFRYIHDWSSQKPEEFSSFCRQLSST